MNGQAPHSAASASREAGFVLGLVIHVALLVVILGMVLFLASRWRARVDLTADRVYTLTDSTKKVLDRIEQRLLVEAYFSADEELTAATREGRRTLRNVLDEYAQQSRGRIAVQYFDPGSDTAVRKRAERLGIQAQRVQDLQGTTLSTKDIWQGLRFRYGGQKQKVQAFLGFDDRPALYEALLTPILKAVTVTERPRIGVMQWACEPPSTSDRFPRPEAPKGFSRLLSIEDLGDRYEFVNVDLQKGQLVPDELRTLILLRPRNLDDRQKYALDQFLMGGGRLAIFADTDDVSLGQARVLDVRRVGYDALGSTLRFVDQLAHYGAVLHEKALVDATTGALRFSFAMNVAGQTAIGGVPYPYWFPPQDIDWSARAADVARIRGVTDQAVVETYRRVFRPGIDHEAARGFATPVFFWPCAVDLAEPLPAGVGGNVLMRSSPFSILERLPQSVSPIGDGSDPTAANQAFNARIAEVMAHEPPQQHGLLVALDGAFKSYFDGRPIPPRPDVKQPVQAKDPLEEPIGEPKEGGDAPTPLGPPIEQGVNEAGPAGKDADPALRTSAGTGAQLLIVADSDFVRDDLIAGEYGQVGPVSQLGPSFFLSLLDWLAQDRDLFGLTGKKFTDRRQKVLEEGELTRIAPERLQEEVERRQGSLRWRNAVIPPLLFVAFGVASFLWRRSRKKQFLHGVGG
ncbi:MAG: GldG family protein [Planctomycetes bacterium]|nr:GldG family protein [Planctomycetota bacterium]